MSVHLRVDWTRCDARGACAELLPELIRQDDWGYPIVEKNGEVPFHLERHARRAVAACPLLALRFEEVPLMASPPSARR